MSTSVPHKKRRVRGPTGKEKAILSVCHPHRRFIISFHTLLFVFIAFIIRRCSSIYKPTLLLRALSVSTWQENPRKLRGR